MKYTPHQESNGDWFVVTSRRGGQRYGCNFGQKDEVIEHCTRVGKHRFNVTQITYTAEQRAKQYALMMSAEFYAAQARDALLKLSQISEEYETEDSTGIAYFDMEEAFEDHMVLNPC